MKKMSEKKDQSSSIIIICFSTDFENYKPMVVIRQYLVYEECSNVKYIKEEGVEFDHHLNNNNNHFKFLEITNIDKSSSKCNLADSYLFLINLEKEEIYEQMELIFSYIQNNGKTEKKIYIIGLYINSNNIKEEYKEENINEFIEQKKLNCEYYELNFDSTNELVKIIDNISIDTIKSKKDLYQRENNNTNSKENNQSGSNCIII